jgi:tetratricopeptide (TPR) repeat protein
MSFYPPGARIAGRYEVVGRPMLGGMGIVYVCLDLEDDRPVALKTFRPEYLPDRAARDRFLREGTHWVDLGACPHIVRCYGVLRTDVGDEVYLVLELVAREEGREDASLRSWLTPGVPLPVETALLFALQIARGMQHAVDTIPGFVHRDLKPENVLVGADRLLNAEMNRLRVTDFGLAAALEEVRGQLPVVSGQKAKDSGSLGRTQLTRGVVGTPLYMAPEQWRGEGVTVATDVYALGCILYEMLAGQRAVTGSSLAALERAHCAGELRPLPAGVSAAVGEVLGRCLALAPRERYGRWVEVEPALAAAYQEVAGHAAPGPEPAVGLGRAERVAAGWSYSAMGGSYLDLDKAEVALGYFERSVEIGQAEGEPRLEAAGLNHLGVACAQLGDARRATSYHEQALAIFRDIGNRLGEAAALVNLGRAHIHLGDARRAVGYLEQQLAITREIGNRWGERAALENLGSAYADLGKTRRAVGYFEQALAISREIGDRRAEGQNLGNLGAAYAHLGNARRAVDYLKQQLAIAHEIGDRQGEGLGLMNLGAAHARLGDAQQALSYWEKAFAIFEEIGDVMNAVTIEFNLAVLLVQHGLHSEALPHAQRAAQVFAQIGQAQYAQQAQQLLAEIRAALG